MIVTSTSVDGAISELIKGRMDKVTMCRKTSSAKLSQLCFTFLINFLSTTQNLSKVFELLIIWNQFIAFRTRFWRNHTEEMCIFSAIWETSEFGIRFKQPKIGDWELQNNYIISKSHCWGTFLKLIPTHKYDFYSGVDSIWMPKTITIIRFQYGDPQNTDTKGKQLIF